MSEFKERHKIVTIWMWIVIVGCLLAIAMTIGEVFKANDYNAYDHLFCGFMISTFMVEILAVILLMRWNKFGMLLMIVFPLLVVVLSFVLESALGVPEERRFGFFFPLAIVLGVNVPIAFLTWAVLHVKKNGISAWRLLQNGWDYRHCRHLYQVFCFAVIVIMGISFLTYNRDKSGYSPSEMVLSGLELVKADLNDASRALSAYDELKAMADEKDPEAMFLLSRFLCSSDKDPAPDEILVMKGNLGDAVQPDNKKAHELLLEVIRLDSVHYKALFELGIDYYRGEERTGGEKMELEKSKDLFKKALDHASEQNDAVYMSKAQGWLEKFDF